MDTLILGLLMLQSRTVYEIKEKIKKGMNMIYSDSLGSIQAAIKKLLAGKQIEFAEVVENGKYKKVYSITEAGREYFYQWVNAPIKPVQSKNSELAKLFFMGLSDKNKRVERIEEYIRSIRQMKSILEKVCEIGQSLRVDEEHRDLFDFQLCSAQYGVDAMQFEIDWYQKLADKLKGDAAHE
jgi:DNA-binding PadR family transcriptional regulator